jgi:hypothetical protein
MNQDVSGEYVEPMSDSSLIAGIEHMSMYRTSIMKRFYDKLYIIFENSQEYQTNTDNFFKPSFQIESDPSENLDVGEYYMYALCYFYLIKSDGKCVQELWLRSNSIMYQIQLTKDSGCIYQSPYHSEIGLIYLGMSKSEGHCFCSENGKGIFFMTSYYLHRTLLLHDIAEPLLKSRKYSGSLIPMSSTMMGHSILDGRLSDDQIECLDGTIKISKAILANHSSYFLYLFTNDKFKKEESFRIDFSKKVLEYYLLYCCHENVPFDIALVMEMIEFGDFIQDKGFLEYFYHQIYENRKLFTNHSIIRIIKTYQELGIQ